MSTRSCVIIKVRPSDIGTTKSFDKNLVKVEERGWEEYEQADADKSAPVEIKEKYIGIYCHFDGYPKGVGAALKEHFNTYEDVLNLVLGGDCSVISDEYIKRYATRKGEEWKYLAPKQTSDAKAMEDIFDWSDYAYLFDDGVWKVDDMYEENGNFKEF
jgi:hypothetical protein